MTLFGFRYPAVIVLFCTVAGTLIGRTVDPGPAVLAAGTLVAGMGLLFALFRVSGKHYIFPLAVFVLTISAANAGLVYHVHSGQDIARYVGVEDNLRFFGTVEKWPTLKRHKTLLICRIDSVINDGVVHRSSGLVQVMIGRETTHFAYGDQVSFAGRLRRPFAGPYPERFDYRRYLGNQGVRGIVIVEDPNRILMHEGRDIIWRHIASMRLWILDCFRDNLTEVSSALASGFLIGQTKNIPEPVYRAFRRTGTMHLLAVSGSNVALVLAAAYFGLRFIRMKRWIRALILIGIIVVFSHLSYNQPSVVRASVMAALVIGARLFYRRMELNNIIAAAATALILVDPANLFDIGFQLSFAVTWGLILFLPHLNQALTKTGWPRIAKYILLIVFSSVIATLISAPITAYYFGEASLVTVASNLVVVPMVSVAVVGSIILLTVEASLPGLSIVVGAALDRLLRWIYSVVLWFGRWKYAEAQLPEFPGVYVFLILAAVAAMFLAVRFRTARIILTGLIVLTGLGVTIDTAILPAPEPAEVELFNSGAVQAIILNSGNGAVIYRQTRDTQRDEFSEDLVPYLARRHQPMPATFIFMEPRYRTERHLTEAAESFEYPVLKPVIDYNPKDHVSVWRADDSGDSPREPTCTISYNDELLSVQIWNSPGVAIMTGKSISPDRITSCAVSAEYLIVMLDDIGGTRLGALTQAASDNRVIIMVNRSRTDMIRSLQTDPNGEFLPFVCTSEYLELSAEGSSL